MQIEGIYYFDYTKNNGICKSIKDFRLEKMTYSEFHLSSFESQTIIEPTEFKITANPSDKIRKFIITHMDELNEISEMLAVNSPKYIMVSFFDNSKIYFEYNKDFCDIFALILEYKPKSYDYHKKENTAPTQSLEDELKNLSKEFQKELEKYKNTPAKETLAPVSDTKCTTYVTPKEKQSVPWKAIVLGLICCIVFFGSIKWLIDVINDIPNQNTTQQITTQKSLTPIVEPESGTILSGKEDKYGSQIKIITSGSAYVVKLKNITGTDIMSFYVRADEEVTVGVPAEELYVYFASGDTWYGRKHLFGEKTSYSKDKEICNFYEKTYTYTLYPVTNGNFSETPIDPEEF